MNDEQVPGAAGSPDDEPEVGDAELPSDEDEDAAPPPDDDSAIPVDPDEVDAR
jgi:hypothetical protein